MDACRSDLARRILVSAEMLHLDPLVFHAVVETSVVMYDFFKVGCGDVVGREGQGGE